jgi:hypothetical protein
MTDLKRALRAFDDVGPDAAVFRRAKGGPTRAAAPSGRPRGERMIAGLTAVAVSALAATFSWRVLRAPDEPGPPEPATEVVELGSDGSTLWPQRTHVELVSAQSRTDAGNGGFRWQLDPDEVLARFAETVIGWPDDTFRTSMDRSGEADGTLVAHLERTEETCPPFTPDDEARGLGRCLPGAEDVTLVQPMTVGDGGVWVVAAVRSPDIGIDLAPGQVIHNGASVRATVATGEDLNAARVVVVGGFDEDRNCFRSSGADPELEGAEVEVSIEPDATAGTECGTSVHGYVVVSTATWHVAASANNVANPINGDSSPYVSVEAIPVVVSIPENGPAPGMNVYEDPLGGWKVDLPEPWYVAPANDVAGERTLTISNDALPIEADTMQGPDPSTFPADLVVLEITRLVGKPPHGSAGNDSTFPLDPGRFRSPFQTTEAPVVAFQGNGLAFEARLFVGEEATDDVVASMLDVVRSLRFPSLGSGTRESGWMSLGKVGWYPDDRGSPTYGDNRWGVIYVVRGLSGAYVLDLVPDSCGEGGNQTWDRDLQQILMECPYGPDIRYERDGTQVAGNPPGATEPLDVYPVITAWDGTLLVSTTTTIDDVERYWPHA